jgi:uncharacterized protein with ParB-like and HNH nuclease domain
MENGQKNLMELFNGDKVFIIPKYQRAYAWGEKQLDEFLDDIHNQNKSSHYFFGTILFEEKNPIDGYEQIEIVDGQQRITTLVIFMKILLKNMKNKIEDRKYKILQKRFIKDEYFHKLQALDIDNEFFKTYIVGNNEPNNKSFDSPSQKRLWKAKKHINTRLSNIDFEKLTEYIEIIEATNVLTYSVKNTGEATLIFETTNDRGKSLTNLEKTKSFLMYKTYLSVSKPNDVLSTIHDRFRGIYRSLDRVDGRIGEDNILQYHFVSFESSVKKSYQNHVGKIKNKLNAIKNEKDISDAVELYTLELKESFSRFLDVLDSKNKSIRDIYLIGRIGNFYPIFNKITKYKSGNEKDYQKVIRLFEIYSFRVYGISNKRSNTGQPELYRLAREFSGDFTSLISSLKNEINAYSPDNEFEKQLRSSSFYRDANNNDKNYLFWKYENYLRVNYQPKASEMSEDEFSTQDPKLKMTIEHITSQKPKNGLQFSELNQENFKEEKLHSIGNLTIDPKSSNSSKGNNVWGEKDEKYFQKAPLKTQLELSDFVDEGSKNWDSECIRNRADKIVEFSLNYWNPNGV